MTGCLAGVDISYSTSVMMIMMVMVDAAKLVFTSSARRTSSQKHSIARRLPVCFIRSEDLTSIRDRTTTWQLRNYYDDSKDEIKVDVINDGQ